MIIIAIIAVVCILFGLYLLINMGGEKDTTDWEAEAYIDNFNDQILKKQPCEEKYPPEYKLYDWEIQRRIKEAKRRRRNIKISPKHFPNQPPLAKKWRKDLDPDEEEK